MKKIDPVENLLRRIEKFCAKHGMTASRFGREAANNPSAVSRLKQGMYSSRSVPKLERYMEEHKR